jgi:hypothetical protein
MSCDYSLDAPRPWLWQVFCWNDRDLQQIVIPAKAGIQ